MKQKNKKVQYLLAVLVVIIWGTIVVQFFNYSGGEPALAEGTYNYLPVAKASTNDALKFSLNLNYHDPFLAHKKNNSKASYPSSTPAASTTKKKTSSRIQQKINPQKFKKYPKVVYKGYSLNNDQITRVNLSINNKTRSMKAGESHDGLLLKYTYRDSLLVSFMGKEQVISRNK